MSDTAMKKYALSHILLAGTSFWCLYNSENSCKFLIGSYGILSIYSLVGTWTYGNNEDSGEWPLFYISTSKIVQELVLPCVVTELYIHCGYDIRYAAIHLALPSILFIMDIVLDNWNQNLVDGITLINIISGSVISGIHKNYWASAMMATYLFNHFIFKNYEFFGIPDTIVYNFGLSIFAIIANEVLRSSQSV